MSFSPERDVVDRLDKISRQLGTLIDLVKALTGQEKETKLGWSAEDYERVGREMKHLSRTANRRPVAVDPNDPLPPSGAYRLTSSSPAASASRPPAAPFKSRARPAAVGHTPLKAMLALHHVLYN